MNQYDIIIIGASTAGSYFARRMSERGFSVMMIDKAQRGKISPDYDIFHMGRDEMKQFGLPSVKPGDGCFAFTFEDSDVYSAFGHFPKPSKAPVVGMHKSAYILRLNDWAAEAGAKLVYGASFENFLYDGLGRISGVAYAYRGKTVESSCRLAVDCSGIPAVGRRSLPESYGVEKFELTPEDLFYVVLKYIKFDREKLGWASWIFYKAWLAPCGETPEGTDGILGVGANFGFDYAEKMLARFEQNVHLPPFAVKRTEKGRTPYHRAIYSFVGDGFLCMGDAASLTKPFNGEGCTATMVLEDIAASMIDDALRNGTYLTREELWGINKKYNDGQGKDFAGMLAILTRVVRHSAKANEFMFCRDIVFSRRIFSGMDGGFTFTAADIFKTLIFILVGLASGNIRASEVGNIFIGVLHGGKLTKLYKEFPETPEGFDAWVKEADRLWAKAGRMSDFKSLN